MYHGYKSDPLENVAETCLPSRMNFGHLCKIAELDTNTTRLAELPDRDFSSFIPRVYATTLKYRKQLRVQGSSCKSNVLARKRRGTTAVFIVRRRPLLYSTLVRFICRPEMAFL